SELSSGLASFCCSSSSGNSAGESDRRQRTQPSPNNPNLVRNAMPGLYLRNLLASCYFCDIILVDEKRRSQIMIMRELSKATAGGWTMLWSLLLGVLVLGAAGWGAFEAQNVFLIVGWALATVFWAVLLGGFYTLQPNQAAVLVLFGRYAGTDRNQ